MKLNLVEVTWLDAEGSAGWFQDDPDRYERETKEYKTYGLLVRKTKHWVILASTKCPHTKNGWSDEQKIPVGMVIDIRVIESIKHA